MFNPDHHNMHKLKISRFALIASLSIFAVFLLTTFFDVQNTGMHSVQATSTATTTVTVLNTPPAWTVTAREYWASATTTPTNSASTTVWTATATDSNGENYYLLICKASSTPTPTASGAPVCGGGGVNQWAVSAATVSGVAAQVSTTTAEAWAERNDWYAYICDPNPGSPRCNAAMYNGLHEAGAASATSSPFWVNHRPTFTLVADDSPTLPGATTTWTTTSDDADTLGGDDTVQLHVCKAQDFNATIPACGAGGFWASSTFALSNVSAEGYITPPAQDKDHAAYVYVVDDYKHPATGATQGSDTLLTIGNATPYVSSSTIAVYDVFGTTTSDNDLSLTVEEGQTDNFVVEFQIVDDNSCEADGGGDEIASSNINVFRYDDSDPYTRALACDSAGEYNANYCYTDTSTSFVPTCYQVPGSCSGATDSTSDWECTFSLWYIADATDLNSQYAGHDWRASARATDDDAAISPYSTYAQDVDGASSEMLQFLSFRATGTPIAYGSLEPGQNNPTHIGSTTVYATGNTGLDEYLSGDAMCVTFPTCSGNATSTIYVPYQHYSLASATAYAAGTVLSTSTAPTLVDVIIPKTTATSSPAEDATYWAIAVPASITYAGDYIGRNYIDAVVSPSAAW
ncbi:MAG: hypothetical protein UV60_C0009G0013 [Parcubacteria group bacterium GW2011_GWA2_43_11]|nr:MAG: hypothetical protein UU89_C0011G0016 [Parcubacteria group bacterium GW2011_GWC2_42_11]KKS85292.1 MAG: hypothetical protein UV60_C0009G0013 [Parcubacteria group bacterium GW2011_GWA2_43_11]